MEVTIKRADDSTSGIDDFINEELSSCNVDHPLTIVMIDMDFFKSINEKKKYFRTIISFN